MDVDYFRYDAASAALMAALATTHDPATRSRHLTALADHDHYRSQQHTDPFGDDPHPDDGTPARDWLMDSARLLWILAEAEHHRAQQPAPAYTGYPDGFPDERTLELKVAVAHTLNDWMRPGTARAALLDDLVDGWQPITRGQAVETVACIPGLNP